MLHTCWRAIQVWPRCLQVQPGRAPVLLMRPDLIRMGVAVGIRTRNIKNPGVGLRRYTPYHFSRSISSSPMDSQPSLANRCISGLISKPSFAVFNSSILFMSFFEERKFVTKAIYMPKRNFFYFSGIIKKWENTKRFKSSHLESAHGQPILIWPGEEREGSIGNKNCAVLDF